MSEVICCNYNNVDTNIHVYIGNELSFLNFIRLNFFKQNEILDIGANIGNHSLFF